MFKFIVILLVVVWLASFFFGSKRKLIRDVNHLLQLILFAALAFIGSSALNAFTIVRENHFVRMAAVVGIFFASWGIALLVRGRLSRGKFTRKSPDSERRNREKRTRDKLNRSK